MLQAGLLDEIRGLLAEGITSSCTAMQAIGYKEFVAALEGHGSVADAATLVQQSSRHYAKRQLTWFRRNPAMHWLTRHEGQNPEEIFTQAQQILASSDT